MTHLRALSDYLELQGVDNVSKLPKGRGQPPVDDPQVYVGAMQPSSDSSPSLPSLDFSFFSRYLTVCVQTASLFLHSFFPPAPFVSITSDIYHLAPRAPAPSVPYPTSINHPNFSCISPTQYAMKVPGHYLPNIVHINHITVCLQKSENAKASRASN